ncbi:hypothetical protein T439DRAFT_89800 [Meredithblackwellia eburnea MCA 4105]
MTRGYGSNIRVGNVNALSKKADAVQSSLKELRESNPASEDYSARLENVQTALLVLQDELKMESGCDNQTQAKSMQAIRHTSGSRVEEQKYKVAASLFAKLKGFKGELNHLEGVLKQLKNKSVAPHVEDAQMDHSLSHYHHHYRTTTESGFCDDEYSTLSSDEERNYRGASGRGWKH